MKTSMFPLYGTLTLVGALALSNCSGIFDGNLFGSIDAPPTLTKETAAQLTPAEISDKAKTDPGFYDTLKSNPEALEAVKDNLTKAYQDTTDPVAAADAARTFVAVAANASDTIDVVDNFVTAVLPEAASLQTLGNDPSKLQAMGQGLFTGADGQPLSAAETKSALLTLLQINDAFQALDAVTTKDTFYASGDATSGDLAQTGLVSAAMTALLAGTGEDLSTAEGKSAAADKVVALLSAPDPAAYVQANFSSTALGNSFSDLAAGATGGTSTNFGYLSSIVTIVSIPGLTS